MAVTTPQQAVSSGGTAPKKLKKELRLIDVYAICTGAMFSSGFFLLPGLAALQTGSSVALAYLIAGILMLPAMFSMAELATAMPRAGGDYYFLDRAMGPLVGTVGGVGTYLALTLKSAFALIGMGAYLALYVNVPIQPLAIGLTIAFTILNIFGAKETTGLQRILVITLVAIMCVFLAGGVYTLLGLETTTLIDDRFTPFLANGVAGLLGTVGFVFVSYAGLTKIASVSEEVINPGRNIPLGMILSIVSTTIIYVVGVVIMTAVLPPDIFHASLTPAGDAAREVMGFLPGELGLLLVVAAAVAAFASTGNAGILAASRYPLAMGRDNLLPGPFARIGKTGTPVFSIVFTAGLMIFAIVALDESSIAKVASTFQLIIFMLINFAVLVMRESRIAYYDPVYRSPLYPYMQIAGVLACLFLISYIGPDALALTFGIVILSVIWYLAYANRRTVRHGAIFHWFSQLGTQRYEGLEHELREILKEKGLRREDPYEEIVGRAIVVEAAPGATFDELSQRVIHLLSQRQPLLTETHGSQFVDTIHTNFTLVNHGAAMPALRLEEVSDFELAIVRSKEGIFIDHNADERTQVKIHAFFFLVSPADDSGRHLRILAQIANHVEDGHFEQDWLHAEGEQELREILLHENRLLTLWLEPGHRTEGLIDKKLRQIDWPGNALVALIRRDGEELIPHGDTVMQQGDRITIIGDEADIESLYLRYVGDEAN